MKRACSSFLCVMQSVIAWQLNADMYLTAPIPVAVWTLADDDDVCLRSERRDGVWYHHRTCVCEMLLSGLGHARATQGRCLRGYPPCMHGTLWHCMTCHDATRHDTGIQARMSEQASERVSGSRHTWHAARSRRSTVASTPTHNESHVWPHSASCKYHAHAPRRANRHELREPPKHAVRLTALLA